MEKLFTYSILQYKHSLLLNESINVGIVFYFPNQDKTRFITGDLQRVKCVYPNFDPSAFTAIARHIKSKLALPTSSLFGSQSFSDYINSLLLPDESSLQFSEPYTATDTFGDYRKTMNEFSKLLLPDTQVAKETRISHDESYLLKRLTDSITKRNIVIDHRMRKNKVIETKGIKLTFEYAWVNGVTHLIKPISFDLKQGTDIQDKSVRYFGYLDLLSAYATLHEYTFDLLIGKPTNLELQKPYENALNVLYEAAAPKSIITEEKLDIYSEETAEILSHQGIQDEEIGEA